MEGAEIQDHQPLTEEDKAQMFVDIMPDGPEDDGIAYLNFYLEEDADKESILRDVRNALEELRTFMDIGEGTIEESQTEDKDWINNWKEYFHQFYVDDMGRSRRRRQGQNDPSHRSGYSLWYRYA